MRSDRAPRSAAPRRARPRRACAAAPAGTATSRPAGSWRQFVGRRARGRRRPGQPGSPTAADSSVHSRASRRCASCRATRMAVVRGRRPAPGQPQQRQARLWLASGCLAAGMPPRPVDFAAQPTQLGQLVVARPRRAGRRRASARTRAAPRPSASCQAPCSCMSSASAHQTVEPRKATMSVMRRAPACERRRSIPARGADRES